MLTEANTIAIELGLLRARARARARASPTVNLVNLAVLAEANTIEFGHFSKDHAHNTILAKYM